MTTLESMCLVAKHFNALERPYVFLGAAVLPLLVDNAEVLEIRPTEDIDLSVEIATLADHYELEECLRNRGFQNDTRANAPICRWVVEEVTVDVMPTEASVLGHSCMWFGEAVQGARFEHLRAGIVAPVITRPYFLATKLAAYSDRGAKDPILSKDLEDIVTLFNGCSETVSLLTNCSDPVKTFIVGELRSLLNNSEFVDAALGNFRSDSVSRERAELVFHRMHSLSQAEP